MKGFRIFLATFALTLTIGALAQDSVIPSKLRVQSIGVNTPAPASGKVVIRRNAAGDVFSICRSTATVGQQCVAHHISTIGSYLIYGGNDSGVPTGNELFSALRSGPGSWSHLTFGNATNNPTYNFAGTGAISGNGSGLTSLSAANLTGTLPAISGANLTSLNAANISSGTLPVARGGTGVTSSTGSGSVVLSNSPALTTPTVGGQQVCVANGTNCPAQNTNTMAAGIMSGIGTCSVSSGALRISSCSRVSAGVYNVNFSVNLGPNNPTCVATVNNNAGAVRSITVQTYNNIRKDVRIVDSAGNATDANFELICVAT